MPLTKSFVQAAATSPLDGRFMLASLLQKKTDNSVRLGQLWGGAGDVAGTTATAPMTVTIASGSYWALSRGFGDGAVVVANNGAVTLQLADAPQANSRIDAIYIKHNDTEKGDADGTAVFGVVTGVAAANPQVPAIPAGALLLATVLIPAGVTTTSAASVVISNIFPFTAISGSPIRYRNVTELNADIGNVLDGVQGYIKGGELYWVRGGVWTPLSNGDTGWTNLALPNGLSGTFGYRRVNGMVCFRGTVSVTSGQFPSGYTTVGTLPAGFRPSVYSRIPIAMFNGYVGNLVINTDGSVAIGASSDRTGDTVYLSGSCFPAA